LEQILELLFFTESADFTKLAVFEAKMRKGEEHR
jgi:hypothetical protein